MPDFLFTLRNGNLLCWAVTGLYATLWALTSSEREHAGTGFCTGGGPASLETLMLLALPKI